MTDEKKRRFRLPPETRAKFIQFGHLLADIVEDVIELWPGDDNGTSPNQRKRRRRQQEARYRPEAPVAETDRKKAEKILTGMGIIRRKK